MINVQLRETRKADLEKHVEAVNVAVREAEDTTRVEASSDGEEDEPWEGLEEPVKVDHEDDYLDEDRHTVVTVEAVDVSHEGLQRRQEGTDEEMNHPPASESAVAEAEKPSNANATNGGREKQSRAKQSSDQRPKKKKKKFRYESKAERKTTRMKERSGGKAKAKERRRQ